MENIRGRDGRSERNAREHDSRQKTRNSSPQEFEGMNFEQQRGRYQNSERGGRPDERSDRESRNNED